MELSSLGALCEHVAAREDALLAGLSPDEALRRQLAERAAARSPAPRARARRALRLGLVAACGAALGAGALGFALSRGAPQEPLSFTVGDPPRPGLLREWMSAAAGSEIDLRFSDGSRVTLLSGSRGRVVRTSAAGAELVAEAGRARVEVIPRPGTDWRLRSGPFDVHVTGTRFVAGWSPERSELTVELEQGRVVVSGCGLGAGVALEPGQRLEASCDPARFTVRPIASVAVAPAAAAPALDATGAGEAPVAAPTAVAAPAPAGVAPGPAAKQLSWSSLARQGHFQRAYAALGVSGFRSACGSAGPDELLLLGDLARLSGHGRDASHAYRTLRSRHPSSRAAARAAFRLGRLPGAAGGASSDASWFAAYLEEQPKGALAEAALGRMLEAEVQSGDAARARALARKYVEQHPAGAHADQARKILGAQPSGG
jgi:hypothetical protein